MEKNGHRHALKIEYMFDFTSNICLRIVVFDVCMSNVRIILVVEPKMD